MSFETADTISVKRFVEARVGTTLRERWKLVRVIGLGGMAAVYEAEHRNRSRCAVKMLHPELSVHEHLRERFLREGYVANTVDHRGVVRVIDDDIAEDGSCFLVMELLRGETVSQRLRALGGRLPPAEALAIVAQALDALAAAHDAGIVHRDLKPSNLFITEDGTVKLLDFGIARLVHPESPSITATGDMLGTPTFMPPEQARGRWAEVDAQSDVWAMGATLFMLVTGQAVHAADTPAEVFVKAVSNPPRRLAEADPSLPSSLCDLVDAALARDKGERFASARAMRAALERVFDATAGHPLSGATPLVPVSSPLEATPVTPDCAPASSQTLTATVRGGEAPAPERVAGVRPIWPWVAMPVVLAGGALAVLWWTRSPDPAELSASAVASSAPVASGEAPPVSSSAPPATVASIVEPAASSASPPRISAPAPVVATPPPSVEPTASPSHNPYKSGRF